MRMGQAASSQQHSGGWGSSPQQAGLSCFDRGGSLGFAQQAHPRLQGQQQKVVSSWLALGSASSASWS